jgi:hypothetical protein
MAAVWSSKVMFVYVVMRSVSQPIPPTRSSSAAMLSQYTSSWRLSSGTYAIIMNSGSSSSPAPHDIGVPSPLQSSHSAGHHVTRSEPSSHMPLAPLHWHDTGHALMICPCCVTVRFVNTPGTRGLSHGRVLVQDSLSQRRSNWSTISLQLRSRNSSVESHGTLKEMRKSGSSAQYSFGGNVGASVGAGTIWLRALTV